MGFSYQCQANSINLLHHSQVDRGIESYTETPVWRLDMTGRLTREDVDWATLYYRGYYWDMPRFTLVST